MNRPLSGFNEQLRALGAPKPPEQPAPEPVEPVEVNVEINTAPLGDALEALKTALEGATSKPEGISGKEVRDAVKALLKGLEPLLKPAELDVAAIVEAIGAIPAPQFEMVLPDADPVPYTFDIQRDGSGNIERVLATPGAQKAAPDAAGVDVE